MGTKSKVVIAITAVLILFVVAVSFYFLILKSSSRPEIGISAPQGWSKIQELNVAKDASGVQYQGTGTIEDAIATFKAEMLKAGWSHVRDETLQEGFTFSVLEKNGYEATIMAVETEPNRIIVSIVAAKSKQEALKELELPKEDVEGEDLTDVPRFPGSIRIAYESCSESVYIEYLTSANVTAITEYYATELPAKGWALEGLTACDDKTEICAIKVKMGFVTVEIEGSNYYEDYARISVLFHSLP
ncbi:MAG: hypothetical protein ACPLKZ_00965 [Candidatus Bathyarchaeales archaeon]